MKFLTQRFDTRAILLVILACHEAGITVTLPKPQTSGAKSEGRFGKQDFVYLTKEDAYRCPAGERLPYRYTNQEDGKMLRRYWTRRTFRLRVWGQLYSGGTYCFMQQPEA